MPPGFRDWEAVIGAGLSKTLSAIATEAGGKVDAFTWGSANRAGIKHPLSEALPGLSILLDLPNEPQTGDAISPVLRGRDSGHQTGSWWRPERKRRFFPHADRTERQSALAVLQPRA